MAELTGKIIEINAEERINDTLTKRTFVIEDDTKWHNTVCFELLNEKTDSIEYYQVGDIIEVLYSVKSRKSKDDRWFTSAACYSHKRAV